jgi:adenosylcobinamide amidohydrolase
LSATGAATAVTGAHSSLVNASEIALTAGAASTTTDNVAIHAMSQDNSQWLKNSTGLGDGKLAI